MHSDRRHFQRFAWVTAIGAFSMVCGAAGSWVMNRGPVGTRAATYPRVSAGESNGSGNAATARELECLRDELADVQNQLHELHEARVVPASSGTVASTDREAIGEAIELALSRRDQAATAERQRKLEERLETIRPRLMAFAADLAAAADLEDQATAVMRAEMNEAAVKWVAEWANRGGGRSRDAALQFVMDIMNSVPRNVPGSIRRRVIWGSDYTPFLLGVESRGTLESGSSSTGVLTLSTQHVFSIRVPADDVVLISLDYALASLGRFKGCVWMRLYDADGVGGHDQHLHGDSGPIMQWLPAGMYRLELTLRPYGASPIEGVHQPVNPRVPYRLLVEGSEQTVVHPGDSFEQEFAAGRGRCIRLEVAQTTLLRTFVTTATSNDATVTVIDQAGNSVSQDSAPFVCPAGSYYLLIRNLGERDVLSVQLAVADADTGD